jgi:outer membrane lipoprotein-sorting protein
MSSFWVLLAVRAGAALALAAALAFSLPALAGDADNAPIELHATPKPTKTPKPKPRPSDAGASSKDVSVDKDEAKPEPVAKPTHEPKPTAEAKPAPDAKPVAEAKPTPAPPSSPVASDKAPLTAQDVIAKADAYLDGARVMTADFVQVGPDGTRTDGNLYIARPGRMLFRYNPPSPLEIVADGRSVAVRDQNLGTQDLYFIAQTPLKFLLSDHIDLAKDTTVKRVNLDDKSAMIEIEDKATFGGKSDITLVFDPESFALKQWTVLDPQGFQTVVTLFDIDLISKPDPSLFHIDDSAPIGGAHRH